MSAAETAAVLLAAQAASGTRPARISSPSRPPAPVLRPVPSPPPGTEARPEPVGGQSDRAWLAALPGGAFVGIERSEDPIFGPWVVTLRRRSGKYLYVYGRSEASALANARREVERMTGGAS